ncbi:hypothetical protein Agub_g9436, partial [Astrephomene gubernaculifera]
RDFSPQQLAGVVWALAVMQAVNSPPFRAAWAALLRAAPQLPASEPVLTQVWQAALALHLEGEGAGEGQQAAGAGGRGAEAGTAQQQQQQQQSSGGGSNRNRSSSSSSSTTEDVIASALAAATAAASSSAASGPALSPSSSSSPLPGPPDPAAVRSLLLRAAATFQAASSGLRRRVQSSYQRQMANTLSALGHLTLIEDNSAGGYSVDISLPALRVAVEADGPTHTGRIPGSPRPTHTGSPGGARGGPAQQPPQSQQPTSPHHYYAELGATAMKRRHLRAMGWQVVNVSYKEWDRLTSSEAKRAFLQERINQALLEGVREAVAAAGGEEGREKRHEVA